MYYIIYEIINIKIISIYAICSPFSDIFLDFDIETGVFSNWIDEISLSIVFILVCVNKYDKCIYIV